jgi:hypothetical protein
LPRTPVTTDFRSAATDVTDDEIMTRKIALAHLNKFPD